MAKPNAVSRSGQRSPARRAVAAPAPPAMAAPHELLLQLVPRWRETIKVVFARPRSFVLLPIRALASELGSDPATVLRIVRRLGFSRYREFQHYLHELSIAHATSLDRMQTSASADPRSLIDRSLALDAAHIEALRSNLDGARLMQAAERVHAAQRRLLLGGDVAISLVHYLGYHLALLGLPCLLATTPGETVHQTRTIGRGDLVIALSFGRGLRQTIEGAKVSAERGAYTIGLTDTLVSPLNRFAAECFHASSETISFGTSHAAPIALLNALLTACATARRERTLALLEAAAEEQRSGYRWYRDE